MRNLIILLTLLFSIHALAINDIDRAEFKNQNALAKMNPGFESGKALWTCSPAITLDTGTQIASNSKSFAKWDSTSAGQTCYSQSVTVPTVGNCEANLLTKNASGGTHLFVAHNGTSEILSKVIDSQDGALVQRLIFPCPSSGTVKIGLKSVAANEPSVSFDNAWVGIATGVGSGMIATPSTPVFINATNFSGWGAGTLASASAAWYRSGDRAYFNVGAVKDGTNGTTTSTVRFTLPTSVGCTIDTSKLTGTTTAASNVGTFMQASTALPGSVIADTSTSVYFYHASGLFKGQQWGANVQISAWFSVPCVGWVASDVVSAEQQRVPKVTTYDTVGGGTHTWSPGATYAIVEISGGGAGGSGGGAGSPSAGGNGGNSTFGSFITAGGGFSTTPNIGRSGPNGTLTHGPPAIPLNLFGGGYTGGAGACVSNVTGTNCAGGKGADSIFGAGGGSSWGQPGVSSGSNGAGGGGGASNSAATAAKIGGVGGGAGAGGKFLIPISGVSISFTVGDGGAGGTAGTDGRVGGAGTNGKIVITEYFGATTALLANSVTTPVQNGEKIIRVGVDTVCNSSPCTIVRNSGFTSVTRSSAGNYTANFSTPFSSAPECFGNGGSSVATFLLFSAPTTTSVGFQSFAGAVITDNGFRIWCVGPR